MIESMTGFCRTETKAQGRKIVIEMRSVNSKFAEIRPHLPRHYSDYEGKILGMLKKSFTRGNIDLYLNEEDAAGKKVALIDMEKAKAFYLQAKKLKRELNASGNVDINTVLRSKEIFNHHKVDRAPLGFKAIQKILNSASLKLKKMRQKEGEHLAKDIKERITKVTGLMLKVDKGKKLVTEGISAKLKKKIEEIAQDTEFDSGRLEQGSEKFKSTTSKNIGKRAVHIVDNIPFSDPLIRASISSSSIVLGHFPLEQVCRKVSKRSLPKRLRVQ